MIKVSFILENDEFLPEDDISHCIQTIHDILHYVDFPIEDMIVRKEDPSKYGPDTIEICDQLIKDYKQKQSIVKQMEQSIEIEVV